ncbi:unnamed protein product [Paramecium pentaurelia]|uniref:Uncharacterized protein n=1 Tax=Paramecium pentaurelia TaxID=43138 RepID=A0A8S1SFM0_9CILI|nr:unnamed protein product [Paramecium pentaurelia]
MTEYGCTCNQIKNQYSCMLNIECQWKFNNCETKSCTQLYYHSNCRLNQNCYYNYMNQSCEELIDCSLLNATSDNECREQSIYCGLYNPTSKQCYKLEYKECNLYTTQSECKYFNEGQYCLWINEQCQNFDCTLIKSQQKCHGFFESCYWEIDNQKCIQTKCDHKSISECSFIFQRQKTYNILQACQIDYSKVPATCKNASISELSPIACTLNSKFFATWSDESFDRGFCQLCNDDQIVNILVIALLIIIK